MIETQAEHQASSLGQTYDEGAPRLVATPGDGLVHVWRIRVPSDWPTVEEFAEGLTVEERLRMQGLLAFTAKAGFVAARAGLRGLLSKYLGIPTASIAFQIGAHGKPHLAPVHGSGLRFSVSHTRDLALCAVGWEREVGVDVEEYIEAYGDGQEILRLALDRIFAPEELDLLRAMTGPDRVAAAYRGWSRKEAILKAAGEVLYGPALPLLDVLSRPGSLILRGDVPALGHANWQVHDLDIGSSHAAAVAFRNADDGNTGSRRS